MIPTKINNITKLIQIEKDLHRDVISETEKQLVKMEAQIDKLITEAEQLETCLSMNTAVPDFREDMMLAQYKQELEDKIVGKMFDLIMTRKNLWLKMTELEAPASDPGRYQNRGGQLLREEKERKAIASNLPKIEAQLRWLVTEYEAKTGNTYTVDGKPLLQLMKDEWEIRKTASNQASVNRQ